MLTNEKGTLQKLSPLTLIMNHKFATMLAETIGSLEDQDHLRRACVGMFNEIITEISNHPVLSDHALLINFLGVAIEGEMNVVKMQEIADLRAKEIFDEIKRRCVGDLDAPSQAD